MPIGIVFSAGAIEAMTAYLLISLLDSKNCISWKQLILFSGLMAALGTVMDAFQTPYKLIFVLSAYTLLLWWMSRQKIVKLAVDVMIALAIYFVIQFATTILIGWLHGNILDDYRLLFLMLVLFLVLAWSVAKIRKVRVFVGKQYTDNREIVFWIAANLFVVIMIVLEIWDNHASFFWREQGSLIALIAVNCGLNFAVLTALLKRNRESSNARAYQEYSRQLEVLRDELFKERHEYKNQINLMIALAQNSALCEGASAIIEYGEKILNKAKREEKDIVICKDMMVSAMISGMSKQAQQEAIRFEQKIEFPFPEYPLSSYDLAELLSNLISNAFEAVQPLPEKDRQVFLEMKPSVIKVFNAAPMDFDGKRIHVFQKTGYSTKEGSRGYGLSNVGGILKKCGGTMNIQYCNAIIEVKISFD